MKLNEIYFEDCISGMQKLPDESIDCSIVDPPYFINYANHDWDKSDDFVKSTEIWVKEVFRLLKPNGTMWSFMGYEQVFDFVPLLNKYGNVHLENWIIAAHAKGRGASKHCKSVREDIFHVTKHPKKYTWNPIQTLREVIAPYIKDGRPRGWFLLDLPSDDNLEIVKHRVRWTGLGNIWNYSWPQHNSICEKQVHGAQKPLMMLERMIRLSSNPGETILDPFMGSGSLALACKISNRNFIGFENDEKNFNIAQERLQKFDITKFTEYNKTIDKLFKETKQLELDSKDSKK